MSGHRATACALSLALASALFATACGGNPPPGGADEAPPGEIATGEPARTQEPIDDVPAASGGCARAGCSGELCLPEGEDRMTTCDERPEYACYREAACERQPDGACGFTPSPELERCLASL